MARNPLDNNYGGNDSLPLSKREEAPLSIEDRYRAHQQKQLEDAKAKQEEQASRRNRETQETARWFEMFFPMRFPDEHSQVEQAIYDNSANKRVGPVRYLTINSNTYYFYPIEKGRIAVCTPSISSGKGCDRICTLSEPFEDRELFDAIDEYVRRSEFQI